MGPRTLPNNDANESKPPGFERKRQAFALPEQAAPKEAMELLELHKGRCEIFQVQGAGVVIRHPSGFATIGFDPSQFDDDDNFADLLK